MNDNSEGEYTCRICFDATNNKNDIVAPCKCDGTMKYVHKACLEQWRVHSSGTDNFNKCPTCGENYKIAIPKGLEEAIEKQILTDSIFGLFIIILIASAFMGLISYSLTFAFILCACVFFLIILFLVICFCVAFIYEDNYLGAFFTFVWLVEIQSIFSTCLRKRKDDIKTIALSIFAAVLSISLFVYIFLSFYSFNSMKNSYLSDKTEILDYQ